MRREFLFFISISSILTKRYFSEYGQTSVEFRNTNRQQKEKHDTRYSLLAIQQYCNTFLLLEIDESSVHGIKQMTKRNREGTKMVKIIVPLVA
ncbi:hypothetical protein WN48_03396 [Eufriesea mexicana]|uniref:Uncharacterized protein n=1 Tax=Eufriesea mexicana TaxID=516756 RepID=A0A310SKG6_9HYME|nr:hypothetical protein WN48_03396 [Eufriesea mexicana]